MIAPAFDSLPDIPKRAPVTACPSGRKIDDNLPFGRTPMADGQHEIRFDVFRFERTRETCRQEDEMNPAGMNE